MPPSAGSRAKSSRAASRCAKPKRSPAARRRRPVPPPPRKVDPNTRAAEDQLKLALGTRVRIIRKGRGGRIEIDFGNEDELQRFFEALTRRVTER